MKSYSSHIRALTVLIIVVSALSAYGFSKTYGTDIKHINNQQVKAADWVNANLRNETCIGTHDIGALAFITKKKIFDMEGLVNPEVFKIKKLPEEIRNKEMIGLLKRNGVNYIIIYPEWFPGFVKSYSKILEKVYSVSLDETAIVTGYEMIIYKIHWENFKD